MKNHILINPLLLEQEKTTPSKKVDTSVFDVESKAGTEDLPVEEDEFSGRIYGPEFYTLTELTKMLGSAIKNKDTAEIKRINDEFKERTKTATGKSLERLNKLANQATEAIEEIGKELQNMGKDKALDFLKNNFRERQTPDGGSFFEELDEDEINQYNEINDIGEFVLFDDKITFIIEKLLDKGGAVDEEGNVFERGGEDYNKIMNATKDNFKAITREVQLKYSTPAVKPTGETGTGDLIDALVWIFQSGAGIANTENMRDLALAASHGIGWIEKDDKGEYRYTGSKEEQEETQKNIDYLFDALNVLKLSLIHI